MKLLALVALVPSLLLALPHRHVAHAQAPLAVPAEEVPIAFPEPTGSITSSLHARAAVSTVHAEKASHVAACTREFRLGGYTVTCQ